MCGQPSKDSDKTQTIVHDLFAPADEAGVHVSIAY